MEVIMVFGAAFLSFLISALGYFFFRNKLIPDLRLSSGEQVKSFSDPSNYIALFVGKLWMSYGIFIMCKHLRPKNNLETFTIAFGLWFLLRVGPGLKHYLFANLKLRAFIIDHMFELVGITIMTFMVSIYY